MSIPFRFIVIEQTEADKGVIYLAPGPKINKPLKEVREEQSLLQKMEVKDEQSI